MASDGRDDDVGKIRTSAGLGAARHESIRSCCLDDRVAVVKDDLSRRRVCKPAVRRDKPIRQFVLVEDINQFGHCGRDATMWADARDIKLKARQHQATAPLDTQHLTLNYPPGEDRDGLLPSGSHRLKDLIAGSEAAVRSVAIDDGAGIVVDVRPLVAPKLLLALFGGHHECWHGISFSMDRPGRFRAV